MDGVSWLHGKPSHASDCTVLSRKGLGFFAQSVLIKLASPQSAWLSIFLIEKNQWCCTSTRDLHEGRTTDRNEKRRKKAQHLAGLEPSTSSVLLLRCVLYRCATIPQKQGAEVTFCFRPLIAVANLGYFGFRWVSLSKLQLKTLKTALGYCALLS